MTTPTLEDARQQREQVATELAAAEQQIATLQAQIATQEAAERAANFAQRVAQVAQLADAADAARTAFFAGLEATLFPAQQTPESIAALVQAYRHAVRTEQQHASAAQAAHQQVQQDIDADAAAALSPSQRRAFVEREHPRRWQSIRQAQSVQALLQAWYDAAKPGSAEALLKSILLAQVVDKRYLDLWQTSVEDRLSMRQQQRLGGTTSLVAHGNPFMVAPPSQEQPVVVPVESDGHSASDLIRVRPMSAPGRAAGGQRRG